jgi:type IV pilus assembly protein PilA
MEKSEKGFTLLEILLVVAAMAILAAIIIIAINPGKQLADTRDSQRWTDVQTILDATYQYTVDNDGNLPATITGSATIICRTGAADCTGLIDLSVLTNDGTYLVAMPVDPSGATTNGTDYEIHQLTTGRITVSAPQAENDIITGSK